MYQVGNLLVHFVFASLIDGQMVGLSVHDCNR